MKRILDMQAHFEEKITFFGRKIKKVPCIICAIWGKMNFLEIFGVKTPWIIGQKSQNELYIYAHFEEKITFFGRKVNKVPCIIVAIWGKNNFLGIFGVKTHRIIGQKSQNSARYAGAFWGKITFFGKKYIIGHTSQKFALYYSCNLRKNRLFGHFWCKNALDYRVKTRIIPCHI